MARAFGTTTRMAVAGCLLACASLARAEEAEEDAPYRAVAVVERPIASGSSIDPTAAATVVTAQDRPRALETTDELLNEVPGAQVRRLGPVGSFSGLSLRGANLEHTTVLLGEVPLGGAEGAAFDLSTLPLSMIDRVEIYRGGAPLALGFGGIGGVLRLVPRDDRRTRAEGSVGTGSFGLYSARANASVNEGDLSVQTVAGFRRAKNDYPYRHDANTHFDPTDDFEARRQNADIEEGWAFGRLRKRVGGGAIEGFVTGYGRTGGLLGSPRNEPRHARRNLARMIAALSYTHEDDLAEGRRVKFRLTGASSFERARFLDLYREVAFSPTATDDRILRTFAQAYGEIELLPFLDLAAIGSLASDRFSPEDDLASVDPSRSRRRLLALGSELRAHGELLGMRGELRASGRVELADSRLAEIRQESLGQETSAHTVAPTLRLAGVLEVVRGLALSSSIATATRIPSLLELFGDRAFVRGRTDLAPERSRTVDVGVVLARNVGPVRGVFEVRAFTSEIDDLIRYRRTAQDAIVPENIARARMQGIEIGARTDVLQRFALTGNATLLRTRDVSLDRMLPLRPQLNAYARPEVLLGPWGVVDDLVLFVDALHLASNFTDPNNTSVIPRRTVFGLGAAIELAERRLRIEASVRDLFDERPLDLVGFPLPGRSFGIELTLRTDGGRT